MSLTVTDAADVQILQVVAKPEMCSRCGEWGWELCTTYKDLGEVDQMRVVHGFSYTHDQVAVTLCRQELRLFGKAHG